MNYEKPNLDHSTGEAASQIQTEPAASAERIPEAVSESARNLGENLLEYLSESHFPELRDGEHTAEETFITHAGKYSTYGIGIRTVSVTGGAIRMERDDGTAMYLNLSNSSAKFANGTKVFVIESYPEALQGGELVVVTPVVGDSDSPFEAYIFPTTQ